MENFRDTTNVCRWNGITEGGREKENKSKREREREREQETRVAEEKLR